MDHDKCGKVLEGQLTPAYLVQGTVGVSQTTTAPTGFQTIQGVRQVRPEVGASPQMEKSPVEGSVHVYSSKIIDKKVVTTEAEVYAVPTTSQARPTTQVETGLLGEAALATGSKGPTETHETAMETDSFSSISVSARETPIEPREGLDTEAYPPLPQSEGVGIGGVRGYDKNPKNLPLGVPAQRRTEAELRPAEVTRPPPTTTPRPSEESHGMGSEKSRREPVVQLTPECRHRTRDLPRCL